MKKVALLVVFCLLLSVFSGCSAESMDLSLARPFAKHDIRVEEATNAGNDVSPSPNTKNVYYYPNVFYDAYYVGEDLVEHTSTAYVELHFANVRSSNTSWYAMLCVDEKTVITSADGTQTVRYGQNSFQYHNPQLLLVSGDSTSFLQASHYWNVVEDGVLWDTWNNGTRPLQISAYRYGTATGVKVPTAGKDTAVLQKRGEEALERVSNLKISNGGGQMTGCLTVAMGGKLDNCYLSECTQQPGSGDTGHFYRMENLLHYHSYYGAKDTVGLLVVSFDVYSTSNQETIPAKIEIPFYYSANS